MPVSKKRKSKKKRSESEIVVSAMMGRKRTNHNKKDNQVISAYAESLNDLYDSFTGFMLDQAESVVSASEDNANHVKSIVSEGFADIMRKLSIDLSKADTKEKQSTLINNLIDDYQKVTVGIVRTVMELKDQNSDNIKEALDGGFVQFRDKVQEIHGDFSKNSVSRVSFSFNIHRVELINTMLTSKINTLMQSIQECMIVELMDTDASVIELNLKTSLEVFKSVFVSIGDDIIVGFIEDLLSYDLNSDDFENALIILGELLEARDNEDYSHLEDIKKKNIHSKTKLYKYIELNKMAEDKGFVFKRSNGDHGIFVRETPYATIIIPQGRIIGRGLQSKILKAINGDASETWNS